MSIDELLQQAELLPPDQQLQFVALLVERIRQRYPTETLRPCWQDIEGTAPYPLANEDAQAWVSRTRREGDERREQIWNQQL
jgi:hypothetical protein